MNQNSSSIRRSELHSNNERSSTSSSKQTKYKMASASGANLIYRDHPLPKIQYPLRVGSSMREGSSSTQDKPRQFSVIKFKFLPESTKLEKGGQLKLTSQKEGVVKFSTKNKKNSTLVMDAVRRHHQECGTTGDYVLVFFRNEFWLEKVPDFFNCKVSTTKSGELSRAYLRQQLSKRKDDTEDADDWMKNKSS